MMADKDPEQRVEGDQAPDDRPVSEPQAAQEEGPGPFQQQEGREHGDRHITVVGIGASAGGLNALQGFFDELPDDTGLAFVVVTHMDPQRESHLPELLQNYTRMPVRQVRDLVPVKPNHVYVIPPNRRIAMTDTHLDVEQFEEPRGQRAPIDHFFRSLAAAHREAIAIVLSGGGTDGAVGVKAVKEQGGLLMVQHPDEAEHDSMPRAAIATGLADVVLPVRSLAEKLVAYRRNGLDMSRTPEDLTPEELEAVYRILTQVQVRTSHDFSQYKRSTILRRVQRRMKLHGFGTLDAYLAFLRHEGDEAQLLFNDLLIGVTNFFRDSEAWEALADKIIPHLFEGKQERDAVRVWTIGCATGEEAYSMAILLEEHASTVDRPPAARPRIQVFASDLDDDALLKAREGMYPEAIETDVSPERLARFFVKEGNYYRVHRELRDIVLFSNHSVLRDPPFSRLDLISCRNLLIYLQRDLQNNVFEIFHYALNPEGYLFLGSSESAEMAHELFLTVDKTHRIYRARPWSGVHHPIPALPLRVRPREQIGGERESLIRQQSYHSTPLEPRLHEALLEEAAPPSVLVDDTFQVLHISKTAGRYLQHPGGMLTGDLLKLVRPELRYEVRTTLFAAFEQNEMVVGATVYVQFNGTPQRVIVAVRPHAQGDSRDEGNEGAPRLALVFFLEDHRDGGEADILGKRVAEEAGSEEHAALMVQLEREVQRLRERLQSTVEEYETSNEELKAANEELQSINEEYRSTSEELETSREELQSVNEELQTVNAELKNKLEEISRAHSDLENLMATTDVATLFLDRDLRIQRYTPGTTGLFNIMAVDRGRPISHLTHHLDYEELEQDARQVLSTLVPLEREVRLLQEDGSGELIWFLVRLRPYRTTDDRIDGVVATFVDITSTKQTEQALRGARERYQLLVQSTTEYAMFTMDEAGIVDSWNRGAERIFGYSEPEILGQPGAIIFVPEDRAEGEAESELRRAREHGEASDERWHMRKDGSRFWASGVLTALRDGERLRGYAKVMRDNTARKEAEEALQQSRDELQALNETLEQRVETRTEMLQQRTEEVRNLATQLTMAEHEERSRIAQVLHDDLQQRLYAIQLQLAFLRSAHNEGDEEGFTDEYESLDEALEEVIRTTRQLNVDLSPAILRGEGLREAIMWLVGQMKEQHGLEVTLEAEHAFPVADEGLRVLLFQAVRELLFNVVKHAGVDVARVELEAVDHSVRVRVIDKGRGFAAAGLRDHAVQASGLATIQRRLNLVGGEMAVNSEVGTGTRVVLTAPLQLAAGAGAETSV